MSTSKEEKKRMEEQIQADLTRMEAKLESTSPGVLDLLRVYGGYESALRQMNNYLSIIQPELRFDTTDGTRLRTE